MIGSEWQRAAISRVPGVTFLPFATAQASPVYLLILRNMLVSTSFTHSPQGITQADDPAAAAAVMGPYYPRASVCPLATLVAKGPAGLPVMREAAGIREAISIEDRTDTTGGTMVRACEASGRHPAGIEGRRK